MTVSAQMIESLVKKAMEEYKATGSEGNVKNTYGIFEDMNAAVEAAEAAQLKLLHCSIKEREDFITAIRKTVLDPENLKMMSVASVEETGIGRVDHKIGKNTLAAEKTPGTEDLTTEAITGDDGITITEYCPFGVIGAITPTTNPTETIICNGIGAIAGGNSIVFSPHPRAKNISIKLIQMLNAAMEEVGAPANLITTVTAPSIENTNAMMSHPAVRLLVATGGPGIVKTVLSSGKKAIGAGAGNPPVVVDETANIEQAAADIVAGASFDNNVPCIAEKACFAVDCIADKLIAGMIANGAYLMTDPAMVEKMVDLVTNDKGGPKVEFVGKSAVHILDQLGVAYDSDIQLIITETGKDHLLVMEELMMPILPIVRVKDADEGIDCALVTEHGNRHTSMIHSTNVETMTKMAKLLQTTIFVKNAPSYAGIGFGGEGCTTFTIAGPTGEGLTTAKSFCRRRRCVMKDGFHIRNF